MEEITNDAWRRLVEADAWWRSLPPVPEHAAEGEWIDTVPVDLWMDMQDRQATALQDVRSQPELMNRLRREVNQTDDPARLALLYEALHGAVLDHQTRPEGLSRDPRVPWIDDMMTTRLAVYLAEGSPSESLYPADVNDSEDDAGRELTRIGGIPTTIDGTSTPSGSHFLVQVDIRVLTQAGVHEGVTRFRRENPLPRGGVLQLFHSMRGDSLTTPWEDGGGATLRYLSEDELRSRLPAVEALQPPGSIATISVLPSFGASAHADASVASIVNGLQAEADQLARAGYLDEAFMTQFERNPFAARVAPVSRLFPVPSPGFELTEQHALCLHEQLPLRRHDDAHVLLLEVTGGPAARELLGDTDRLQVWLRRSDLRARRYDSVVSFMRRGPLPPRS